MPKLGAVPGNDDALLAWSVVFQSKLTATPVAYGMTAAQATTYSTAHTAFATALAVTKNVSTRTKETINTKDAARDSLRNLASSYGRMISANVAVTDALKIGIGVNVRATPVAKPIPAMTPALRVDSVNGWVMKLTAADPTAATKRGKPKDVAGVMLFSYVGATAPSNINQFKFEGSTTQTTFDVVIDSSVAPGSAVWFTAFYFNSRQQSGPACAPISAHVQFGGMSKAA